MAQFQLLQCMVALGGDNPPVYNIIARTAFNPVTYPEMLVLRYIHGQDSVTEIFDCGSVERDERDEFSRLCETYGQETVKDKMFPGAGNRLPIGDAERYKPRVVGTKINPGPAPAADPVPAPAAAPAPVPSIEDALRAMFPGETDAEIEARVAAMVKSTPAPVPAPETVATPPVVASSTGPVSRRPTPVATS